MAIKKLTEMQRKDQIIKTLQDDYDELFKFCQQVKNSRDDLEVDLLNLKHQVTGYKAVISYLESKIR